MKQVYKILALLCVVLLLSSCTTVRETAATAPVQTSIVSIGVADVDIEPETVSRTYSWSYWDYAFKKCDINQIKENLTAELLQEHKADVLVEPQFIVERGGFFRGGSVTVIGRPGKYKNFRNLSPEEYKGIDLNTILNGKQESQKHKRFLLF